jgi:WD40 repeat protein
MPGHCFRGRLRPLLILTLAAAGACRGFPAGSTEGSAPDPSSQSVPATVAADPGSSLADPGSALADPGSALADPGSALARAVVNTGHTGAVLGLAYDDRRGLLFSAGDDGTVRVWDPAAGILQHVLRVSQLAAGPLAVNPSAPQVAVVLGRGTRSPLLSVWDWQAERELFRVPIRETPLFLHYSALGTYLMYSDASWQSLTIRRSETGEQVAFHPEGFGIVGFAEMSRSEKTILTYQVAGKISTWDFATGTMTGQVPTVPALADVRISRDFQFLAGTVSDEIVTVDLVTGARAHRAPRRDRARNCSRIRRIGRDFRNGRQGTALGDRGGGAPVPCK